MSDIFTVSATELARRVRTGETTSVALVEACIDAVQRVNPAINAMVVTRFDEARAEARAADAKLKEVGPDKVGAFHGVPCSIKESFAFEGMPNTAGLKAREGLLAPADSITVARLRAAGAIPLGVTNTSELCMWMESNNRVYGLTKNPYDQRRTAGGSSGGEGAIVGAGALAFGLGSDIGGSIRMPAFFNGVFGHKPSSGLVPSSGQYPETEGDGMRYLGTGPITRRAEDLWPLLNILRGPDGEDETTVARELPDPSTVRIDGLRVLSVETNHLRRPTRDLINAQRLAASTLEASGAQVAQTEIKEFRKSLEYWAVMLGSAPGRGFGEQLGVTGLPVVTRELARWATRRSDHTLPALLLALIEGPAGGRGSRRADKIIAAGHRFRDSLNERLGTDGVMLFPPYPAVAPRHYWAQGRLIDWLYTAIFNVTELAVTQVPLGLDKNGLPLGVQVVAGHGQDHLSLAVALELERRLGGWQPPALMREAGLVGDSNN